MWKIKIGVEALPNSVASRRAWLRVYLELRGHFR